MSQAEHKIADIASAGRNRIEMSNDYKIADISSGIEQFILNRSKGGSPCCAARDNNSC